MNPDACPIAKNIVSQLRYRSVADRTLVRDAVFEEMERRGTHNRTFVTPDQKQQAIASVRRYRKEHGEFPSRAKYDAWMAAMTTDQRSGLLTSNQIRGAFKGWARAMEASGEPISGGVLSRRYTATGPRYGASEIIDGLQRWAATVSADAPLIYRQYREWVDEQALHPDPSQGRLVASIQTIHNHFGSWPDALRAAGLDPQQGRQRRKWDRDGVIALLVEVDGRLPEETRITSTLYRRETAAMRCTSVGDGGNFSAPAVEEIAGMFGSWQNAVIAAGLLSTGEARLARTRTGPNFTNNEIDTALRDFAREHYIVNGQTCKPKAGDYENWRARWIAEVQNPRVPTSGGLRRRLGSWSSCAARIESIRQDMGGADPESKAS